jgi:diphthamide synthase (EF-2-diphthine--ammonia ligase)
VREVWLWWSSGKDSAWALHALRRSDSHRVTRLLTTVNAEFDRVAMHAVRTTLLEEQAAAAGLPVERVELPWPCSNDQYEAAVHPLIDSAVAAGVPCMAFGDLFLEDVHQYRLDLLAGHPIEPVFPTWGLDTTALAHEMIDAGLRAWVTCVDPRVLPRELAGRPYGRDFLESLPDGVDPCGENGEFHTFAWDGPMFGHPVPARAGDVVSRDGFVFVDLLPDGDLGEEER